ncbi:hypothetical protein [Nostoc sp. TCL240-02]|uniref:hypothetical protein n=1 Tax=Nostoc sp. TCL240-02 TaxID=2572090 RepID=UPI00157F8E5D|nr:hypothetical protein [Nostoc sp. TCL240-02]QKQ76360.1 hypothetical protein FBB35_26485 [Nostoc sp. TCL240-02]
MTRLTFASVHQYALDNGYQLVRTSEGYSLYPEVGNLAERMGGYKTKTLKVVMEVIKEGCSLHGQYCPYLPPCFENGYRSAQEMQQLDELWEQEIDETDEILEEGIYDSEFCKEEGITAPEKVESNITCMVSGYWIESEPNNEYEPNYESRTYNTTIQMLLLAFNVKLTTTVIELYCAEISQDASLTGNRVLEICADDLGTEAMYLGFQCNELLGRLLELTENEDLGWEIISCINYCTNEIQPILRNNTPCEWDDFNESEESFNTRIALEEMYRLPMPMWYWDTDRYTLCSHEDYEEQERFDLLHSFHVAAVSRWEKMQTAYNKARSSGR